MGIRQLYREIIRKGYNKQRRDRLHNPNVTVFSSNCVGGVICHDLGLRFNSPTVNLFMNPADYLRFLGNISHYLAADLKQVYEDGSYPVGMLDDVRIDFVHYASFYEAAACWKRRCERVDLTHCCAIMIDRDGCTPAHAVEFSKLPFESKVFLTASASDLPCAISNRNWFEPNGQT